MPTQRYQPLYQDGKRDKAKRFRDTRTNTIVSYRKYIKITEGVSPEEKAVQRVKAGKAKPGKTYKRYLERKAKKEKKPKVQQPKRTPYTAKRFRIVDRVKDKDHVNLYQLVVTAVFRKVGTGQKTVARGYSTLTHSRYVTPPRYGTDYYYRRRAEALRHAKAQVLATHAGMSGEWVVEEVIDEFWLRH